jgi:alpha-tubulin suppressor-like RCC1 family protein
VTCGFRHVIARTSLGKVYTWGWGASGQLGQGTNCSELSPRILILEKNKQKLKVAQVAAGYEHSILLI